MNNIKKILHFLFGTVTWLAIGILIISLLAGFLSSSSVLGKYHLYIVQSGSMEPSIMTGDIIITSSQRDYKKNEAITFTDPSIGIVTHRIWDITGDGKNKRFLTKGDANRSVDSNNISLSQVIGKVVGVLPKLGYVVVFSRKPLGVLLLIGIPAVVIIFEEIFKLKKAINSQ
ncbi:MAG: signal peptidase I [Candidatus Shapirobacteria bacterium]|nr:signal peptidase I [Candidatus Shapirobacteria bacterium]MDD4410643.1 signal peptidase I [Candidatus Shapirobacteria bacterium]